MPTRSGCWPPVPGLRRVTRCWRCAVSSSISPAAAGCGDRPRWSRPWTGWTSRSTRGRCSGWSASRAAARAPRAGACCAWWNPRRARSGFAARTCWRSRGSGCGWRAATCRSSSRIPTRRSTRGCACATSSRSLSSSTSWARATSAGHGWPSCSISWGWIAATWIGIRTSSAAASGSASASPARWRSARRSSSPTKPCRRWTSRFRRRW